jgi:heptosyltransferase-2
MATPFLFALRERMPLARITLLSREYAAELFRRSGAIDRLAEWRGGIRSRVAAARKAAPAGGFDACFVLAPSFSAALVSLLSGARRRIGYGGEGRRALLTDALPAAAYRNGHLSRVYVRLLERYTGREEPDLPLPAVIPDDAWKEIADAAAGRGAYFALAPGATYGASKVWPRDRYAALARLVMTRTGWTAVVVGRPEERAEVSALIEAIGERSVNLAGRLSVSGLISVLRGSRLVVGNDSGPVHIAAALAVPTVAVFGPTSADWTAPRGRAVRIVKGEMACAPCFKRRCPHGAPECLVKVEARAVFDAAVSLIEEAHGETA